MDGLRDNKALQILGSFGSINEYRVPERARSSCQKMGGALVLLRKELVGLPTADERWRFSLDVMDAILQIMRGRASFCENEETPCVACENVDTFYLMAEWLEIVRSTMGGAPAEDR